MELFKEGCLLQANTGHKESWINRLAMWRYFASFDHTRTKVPILLRNTGIFAQPIINLTPDMCKALHMPEKAPVPKKPIF